MSPIITQIKQCPDCLSEANLTGWRAPVGLDPLLRQYLCSRCGNEFYILGGQQTYDREAQPAENKVSLPYPLSKKRGDKRR